MALKKFKPTTPSRRQYTVADFTELTDKRPEKSLVATKRAATGRNNYGRFTNINKGGGQMIHNIELKVGAGAKLVRSAGTAAQLVGKEGAYCLVKMPSGELRKIFGECYATIGIVGNAEHKNIDLGKAGRNRWLNRKPHTRGVAKNPVDHPMGGGEGKSSGGRHPCTPKGKPTKGYKTRTNKRTNKFIVRRRSTKKR